MLIHIEVQNQPEDAFAERLFMYHYRLFDRHQQPVVTLAILTDDDETWRPEHYSHERWGCRVVFEFPIAKLTDWHAERARLEASRNPIALIVLAHDITRVTKHEPLGRAMAKFGLIRRLFALGYKRQDVLDLLRILDWARW